MHESSFIANGVRPEVTKLPIYNAGLSSEYVRAHFQVEQVAKLGSNENPYGASPKVAAAIAESAAQIALYPDSGAANLRDSLSRRLGIDASRFVFGNGSEDLIAICAHTFLSPGDEMVTLVPSFGLHITYPQSVGARVATISMPYDYAFPIAELTAAITPLTRMVMISNPSNPVGVTLTADQMERLLSATGENTLIIFDEAYFEYAAAESTYPDFLAMLATAQSPWITLRTFSKAYGLAGLRIGYGIASDPSLVDLMDRIRAPFNVNRFAQTAAVAALDDVAHMESCVSRTRQERERVRLALNQLGYAPAPSLTNFLFFDTHEDASALAVRLLPYGVIVKPWRETGFLNHLRVSIGSPQANDQFLAALSKAAGGKSNARTTDD